MNKLARKVIALKTENMSGDKIIGIGVLIVALGLTYYLIKRAGLMACKMDDDKTYPRRAMGKGDEKEI
ncbi:MAG: phosphate-starvation-inducible PsiE family protein [Bacteroidales bacterium]